jgi:hypothetical protein
MAQCRHFRRRRLVGEDGDRKVAGEQCRDQEGQQGNGDQDRNQIEHPAPDEPQHLFYSSQLSERSITSL